MIKWGLMKKNFKFSRGFPLPFGTSKHHNGINFSIFSKHATSVTLICDDEDIFLDPRTNKTGDVWHIFVFDLPPDTRYGYRVDGPYDPFAGLFFNNRSILHDPYTKQLDSPTKWKEKKNSNFGIVQPLEPFNWEDDFHPNIPFQDLIIYEMHTRGFTNDPSSNVKNPGTFLGLIEKIPYLKELGVNAVELMPIHEFNENDSPFLNPVTKEPLCNYWGYATLNFFSPMRRYGSILDFKHLVKELHKHQIEVILDVVYNHTAEGDMRGPRHSFKGFENEVYYMMTPDGHYYNFSGCGNTFNANHPIAREFIRESLRYWVKEMHVDGFRFDLASSLVRSNDGMPLSHPPLIESLACDPVLASTKLIAEAWDAGGLYQVGSFPAYGRFAEWNGQFRDHVRRFIKGTDKEIGAFATRLCGSEDLYGKDRKPYHSINFITSHDGFSLADLVSYNEKHNEANGEENRDGDNNNESWNCGAEGLTDDPKILELRARQIRNFLVSLFVSQGVPMLLMGDEYGHSKGGNNNTWGHDSRLNWFQWDTLENNRALFNFCKKLIELRKNHKLLHRAQFLKDQDITWHGVEQKKPDWSEHSRLIAFSLVDKEKHQTLYIAFNAHYEHIKIQLPPKKKKWYRLVDTTLDEVHLEGVVIKEPTYLLTPNSAVILKN